MDYRYLSAISRALVTVLQALTDKRELSGSAAIVLQEGDFIDDVTIHESTDPDEFPLKPFTGDGS